MWVQRPLVSWQEQSAPWSSRFKEPHAREAGGEPTSTGFLLSLRSQVRPRGASLDRAAQSPDGTLNLGPHGHVLVTSGAARVSPSSKRTEAGPTPPIHSHTQPATPSLPPLLEALVWGGGQHNLSRGLWGSISTTRPSGRVFRID